MRYTIATLTIFFSLAVSSCSPQIDQVSPRSGLPGTIVKIEGRRFADDTWDNKVTIGGSSVRVISGNSNEIRVVALRDVVSGKIEVDTGSGIAVSPEDWKRAGSTLRPTPDRDADAKLIEGSGYPMDKRYDMAAQGTDQKILIILAKPNDIDPEILVGTGPTARDDIAAKLPFANRFFSEASYGKTSVDFGLTPNWVSLSQPRDFYFWTTDDVARDQADVDAAQAAIDALMLDPNATEDDLDAAQEALDAAIAARDSTSEKDRLIQQADFLYSEATLGAEAMMADFDDYTDYFIVVAGPSLRGQCCWVEDSWHAEHTAQNLTFDIDFDEPKGHTYVAQETNWGRMVHELSHFFAGGDLYGQTGNARAFAMMGSHDTHPLYIGPNMENLLDYFDESANGNVEFLQWGSTADFDDTFNIVTHAVTENPAGDNDVHLVKLQVADGLQYFIEVRQKPDATVAEGDYIFDPDIPLAGTGVTDAGVIVTKSVGNNNQSNNQERPITLLPPARMLQVGDVVDDPARTIRISVVQKLDNRPAKYQVRVEWGHLPAADPNGQFDLRIDPWTPPPWESEDIWANSPKNDETSPAKIIYENHESGDETQPIGNGDPPWVGKNNTLFARIANDGTVDTPESVRVTFYVNTPPGIGDDGTWAPFDTVDVGVVPAGTVLVVEANKKWKPAVDEHTCVKVFVHAMTGEITFDNNFAQENFGQFETAASSPYSPVEYDVVVRNPYDVPTAIFIHAHRVPKDWFVAFDSGAVFVAPGEEKPIHVLIWTDRTPEWEARKDNRTVRKPLISIEGWAEAWQDQTFAFGGVTAFVHAVRATKVEIVERQKQSKQRTPFEIHGQLKPPSGPADLAIHIVEPDGKRVVERTTTGADGRFHYVTKHLARMPGTYKLQVFVLGGSLASTAESVIWPVEVL